MTTTVATSSFEPLVMPWIQGAPRMAIRLEIARAANRFCHDTLVWKEYAPAVSIVAATHTYTIPMPLLPSPTQAEVVQVEEAYVDGWPIVPATKDELRLLFTDWNTAEGTPTRYTQDTPDAIRILPIPQAEDALVDGLTLYVAYKPLLTATLVPAFLFSQYGQAVAAGAIASLASMKGRSWYDPSLAKYYMGVYGAEVTKARIQASKAFSKARKQVRQKFV